MSVPLGYRMMTVALVLSAGRAYADENRIAIESYIGPRTPEAARAMAHLAAALEQWRFTARPPALKKQLGEHVVSAGLADPRFTTQAFWKQVETGLNAVVNEQYELAARTLVAALDGAGRNSLMLARDPKSREARLEALIYLARAYKHLGKAAARDEAMTEVIRSYPDKVITAKKYGPDAEEIYEAVKRGVDRGGRGRLSVEVTDPDAIVYVDEMVRGRGKALLGDLLPGPHRVLVDGPSGESRRFRVTVIANQHTRLNVDWEVDSVLVTGDWVGLQLAAESDREREGLLARKLAGRRTGAVMVAVISAARVNRRLVVSGTVHAVTSGKIVRSGRVVLTGRGDHKRLEQLAAYLGFQAAGEDVAVIEPAPHEPLPLRGAAPPPPTSMEAAPPVPSALAAAAPPAPAEPRPRTSHAREWMLGGAGIAATAAGALLIALDGTGNCGFFPPEMACRQVWGTKLLGAITLAAGSALTTAAVTLHLSHPGRREPAITAVPVTGGVVGVIGWSFH
jgi:hypothetical protein